MRSDIFDHDGRNRPLLNDAARDRMPVVNDPEQAEGLLRALLAAINDPDVASVVSAQFRAGAIWQRKVNDTGGSLSPRVSPSHDRDSNGDDELYLSVEVRVPSIKSRSVIGDFVASQRAAEGTAQSTAIEEQIAAKRAAISVGETELGELVAQLGQLRRSDAGGR